MIDLEKAKNEMEIYISQFEQDNPKIANKKRHTYSVVNFSKMLSRDLGLNGENSKLAELIALLHDIGRFEQLKRFDSCIDHKTIDHGDLGVEILVKDNFIRNFVKEDKYDNIIFKAIRNHNKYKIQDGLNEIELLHCKIIRDSDKLDNFYKQTRIENYISSDDKISDKIYNDFCNRKSIVTQDVVSNIDMILWHYAWVFDFNYKESYKLIKKDDIINKLFDTIKICDGETKNRLDELRKISNEYVNNRILE